MIPALVSSQLVAVFCYSRKQHPWGPSIGPQRAVLPDIYMDQSWDCLPGWVRVESGVSLQVGRWRAILCPAMGGGGTDCLRFSLQGVNKPIRICHSGCRKRL